MKDIINKLAQLELAAQKDSEKKVLTEQTTNEKPKTLKDTFESLAGQKPIPVVGKEGSSQQTGAGFVNVTDPALQSLGKTIGDLAAQKKLQIVVPNAQQNTTIGKTGPTVGGQGTLGIQAVTEKWGEETTVAPSEKGKYAGKNKAELTKQYNKLKASGPHKKGSPEYSKMRELSFAIRAKSDWGKVQESKIKPGSQEHMLKLLNKYADLRDAEHNAYLDRGTVEYTRTPAGRKSRKYDWSSDKGDKFSRQLNAIENEFKKYFPDKYQEYEYFSDLVDDELNLYENSIQEAGMADTRTSVAKTGDEIKPEHDEAYATLKRIAPSIYRFIRDEAPMPIDPVLTLNYLRRSGNERQLMSMLKSMISSDTEKQYGKDHPSLAESVNRLLRKLIRESDKHEKHRKHTHQVVDKTGRVVSKHHSHKEAMAAAAKNDDYKVKTLHEGELEKEQLGELSSKTLGSYVKKASSELPGMVAQAGSLHRAKKDTKLLKRQRGIDQAVDKMTNEGAKVDRMVKHIEKSEKKAGKSNKEAENIAWATANKRGMLDNKNKKKVKEADLPSVNGVDTRGAGLGAGRSTTTLENKDTKMNKKSKPDFLDMDKDGNKKEPMKKALSDKKKKTVKESLDSKITAARHEGRADGLRGLRHRGKHYDEMEESKAYHEGYKDGLDECYGMGVYEGAIGSAIGTGVGATLGAEVGGPLGARVGGGIGAKLGSDIGDSIHDRFMDEDYDMMDDDFLDEDDMEEGNAFTGALARTPRGGKFSVGGRSYTDNSSLEESDWGKVDEMYIIPDIDHMDDEAVKKHMDRKQNAKQGPFGPRDALDRPKNMIAAIDKAEPEKKAFQKDFYSSVVTGKGKRGAGANVPGISAQKYTLRGKGPRDRLPENYAFESRKQLDELSPATLKRTAAAARGRGEWSGAIGDRFGDQDERGIRHKNLAKSDFALAKKADAKAGSTTPTSPQSYDWEKKGGYGMKNNPALKSKYAPKDTAFESWDKQLKTLINEDEVKEGVSVSISKGQQNAPDSVTITASDNEADQLLAIVKNAGMGLFGDDAGGDFSMPQPHQMGAEAGAEGQADITVVDDNDDMLSLMGRLSGIEAQGPTDTSSSEDYADENGAEYSQDGVAPEACASCGCEDCECDDEEVNEVESEDQMEFKVSEENAPDSDEKETSADEAAEAQEDEALANKDSEEDEEDEEENVSESFHSILERYMQLEQMSEAKKKPEPKAKSEKKSEKIDEWANGIGGQGKDAEGKGTDASFERDIEFMTKVIAGGLNKPKSTGQTTIPVIAGQDERTVDSIADWTKLAGIKK